MVMRFEADAWSDDICLQLASCQACGQKTVLLYEESRRGSLDSDSWSHLGYLLEESTARELHHWFSLCPAKDDTSCGCCAHRHLSRTDSSGCWDGLEGFVLGSRFFVK